MEHFFEQEINLLIHISNTIDRNIKIKVLKILEDVTASRLITKRICSRPTTHLIIKKILRIPKILDL